MPEGWSYSGQYYKMRRTAMFGWQIECFTPGPCPCRQCMGDNQFLCAHPDNEEWGEHIKAMDDAGLTFQEDTATTKTELTAYGCSNCGFFGHNNRTCTRTVVYDKVGIEIEGRYYEINAMTRKADEKGLEYSGDGSVYYNGDTSVMEFKTKPGLLSAAVRQLVDFYPDQADRSCGLHVHVSFKSDTHIGQLYTREFLEFFRARWRAWGESKGFGPFSQFFQRLNGHNDFCKDNLPEFNAASNPFEIHRYVQMNFSSWLSHKTVECRLLPMFRTAALSVEAVQYLLTIYEDWFASELSQELAETFVPTVPAFNDDIHLELPDVSQNHLEMDEEVVTLDLPPVQPGFVRVAVGANPYDPSTFSEDDAYRAFNRVLRTAQGR